MARHRSFTLLCATALVVAPATFGCAAGGNGASPRRPSALAPLEPLTADEIRRAPFNNAYDLLQHLRPAFLIRRGPTSILMPPAHDIVVIINDQTYGGVEELRTVPTAGIRWVRRLSPTEVYGRIGRSAPSGGIEIRLGPPE
jgi:hypothetical protein